MSSPTLVEQLSNLLTFITLRGIYRLPLLTFYISFFPTLLPAVYALIPLTLERVGTLNTPYIAFTYLYPVGHYALALPYLT